jgi:hypothetical protein
VTAPEWFRVAVDDYVAAVRSLRAVPKTMSEAALYVALDRLLNVVLDAEGPHGAQAVQQAHTEYGVPDFVLFAGAPIGYVEAKRPAADLSNLTGHDARQREAYANLPNVLYTNYRDFELLEFGSVVDTASLGGLSILAPDDAGQIDAHHLDELYDLFRHMSMHAFEVPRTASELAIQLARATRVLFDTARTALRAAPDGALATLREEWRHLLFDQASDDEFADAYAQTVAYGLLMAHMESPKESSIEGSLAVLEKQHEFLGAALRLLTHPKAVLEVQWAIEVVQKIVTTASPDLFRSRRHRDDPLLYFYEDFLSQYDGGLRKRRGAYYTPASVVRFQVQALADLVERLGRPRLLADEGVIALDPAVGTGTYLLGLLDETLARTASLGEASSSAAAVTAARQINGFELLVGPYTVARQRVAARLRELGAPGAPVRVYLADTLAEADAPRVGQLSLLEKPLAEEKALVDEVKHHTPVMMVVGNPPYARGKGRGESDWLQQSMSWFTDPVPQAARVNLKSLADPYVHFYRWALWKLFHSDPERAGPRLLSFISNRSYLGGDAFYGMRLRLREMFDELWIIDVGGESRGPAPSENVFDVRVGVAILVGVRADAASAPSGTARVLYTRLEGTRAQKEVRLASRLDEFDWVDVSRSAGEPFIPPASKEWSSWMALDTLMPVRQSGVQTKRDRLVVAPTRARLRAQLNQFASDELSADERRVVFHPTRDRDCPYPATWSESHFRRVQYRPLDVRWLYDDERYIDFPRPRLHALWHPGQRAFVTLPKGHGAGPAAFVAGEIPDLHAYRGSYGGHAFPFWRDEAHKQPNIVDGLLVRLRAALGDVSAEDVFSYLYGLLQAPSYTTIFATDLELEFPRVPFTADAATFAAVVGMGTTLLTEHLLESEPRHKLAGEGGPLAAPVWSGGRLIVAPSAFVEGVSEAAWNFVVSGYPVLRRWVEGRRGLDLRTDLTLVEDLLKVVSAISRTVELAPRLDAALAQVLAGPVLGRSALVRIDAGTAGSAELADERATVAEEMLAFDVLSDEAWEQSS